MANQYTVKKKVARTVGHSIPVEKQVTVADEAPASPLQSALDSAEFSVDHLSHLLSTLETRLQPVLIPHAEPSEGEGIGKASDGPVVDAVNATTARVGSLSERVSRLLDYLAV